MNVEAVTAERAFLVAEVSDPEDTGSCKLTLRLDQPVFVWSGDTWWVEDDRLMVRRGDGSTKAHPGVVGYERRN
ncbi:hypothetical protein AB0M43_34225 [Longispora sp. NPDC051575]|uniref:hypothetical protein n=1 Tax=Longispora sp. NPDC051575 TaxID=3154943 RepID=UPI00343A9E86